MFTTHNNNNFKIDWQYESPELLHLLNEKGISAIEARKMKRTELKEILKLNTLPLPTMVKCIITNTTTNESTSNVIELGENQRYNKEEMRKDSMAAGLNELFPGTDNKPTRKVFFDSYLNRKMDKNLKRFLKLAVRYEAKLDKIFI